MTLTIIGHFSFSDPKWLLLGAFAAALVVAAWRRSLVDFSRRQQQLSLTIRLLLVVLGSAVVAGLTWHRTTRDRFVVLAIDRSQSCAAVDAAEVARWKNELQTALGDTQWILQEFDGVASSSRVDLTTDVDSSAAALERLDAARGFPVPSLRDDEEPATHLSAAVALARAAIPSGYVPHIVLLSDGRETRGNVLEQTANDRSIPISTVPIASESRAEVQVDELAAPAEVRVGEPFELTAVIQSRQAGSAQLILYRDGLQVETASGKEVMLKSGENRITLLQQIDSATTANYAIEIVAAADHSLDDNQGSARVVVAGQPRLLAIDTEPESLDSWRWALEEQQIQLDVRPPSGLPSELTDLAEFDAVVLSQVSATDLSPQQMEMLRQYVQTLGGGLLMLGSDQSFGLGGYYKTSIDALLPVRCDLEQEKEKPSLAMVLVIDRSGSMGGLKLKLAKDAAEGTVELLGPRDQMGLIAFDDDPHWVSPLRSAADKLQIIGDIRRLNAAGGTNLFPALSQAGASLKATAAKLKHVILLTDGISAPADFTGLIADLATAQITVSAVAVGEQADRKLLESLAQQGGGRFYDCQDPRAVPQIFAQETILASKSAVEETPFVAQVVRATATLRGLDFESAPVLLGRVITRAKPTAEVVLATDDGDPLLVWWRHGLGMTLAFTSDVKSRWAAEWLSWPDFAPFWAQCVRHVMRSKQTKGGELTVVREGSGRRLLLDLRDDEERFVSDAQVEVALLLPGSDAPQIESAAAVAPGRYEFDLPTDKRGTYLVEVTARRDQAVLFRQSQSIDVGFPEELRIGPINEPLLRQLAAQTGGLYNPSVAEVLQLAQPATTRPVPLWRALLTLMLFLFLLDVALRRIEVGL